MSTLSKDINNLKSKYREIFLQSADELNMQVEKLKPQCTKCIDGCELTPDLFTQYPEGCVFKKWQKDVLELFDKEISKEIYAKWIKVLEYSKEFKCNGCACCCKLACSEFSYEELKQKASKGDNFATQFTSVFIPYESKEQAQKIYPEYFKLLEEKGVNEDIYFYHCPKLDSNNRCSDYENRPQICREFPNNPLSLLPPSCGYSGWKQEVEPVALMLHSMLEIIDFYKEKIPK